MIEGLTLILFLFALWNFTFEKNKIPSVLIILFFITDGFQLLNMKLLGISTKISKFSDVALILIILFILIDLKHVIYSINSDKIAKIIFLFLMFITVYFILNNLVLNIDAKTVLRAGRQFYFLLFYFILLKFKGRELLELKKYLKVLTIFLCIVYILQIPLGKKILTGGVTAKEYLSGVKFTRFYNLPYFLILIFFTEFHAKRKSYLSLMILSLPVLFSLHRSLILGIVFTVLLVVIMKSDIGTKIKIPFYLFYITILLALYPNFINDRFENTIDQIKKTFQGRQNAIELQTNTFSFRIGHFYERYNYVTKDINKFIFGVGFITEDSPYTKKLNFKIGAIDKDTGKVFQVNTGDISWSLIILNMGILGTIIYIGFLINILAQFRKFSNEQFKHVGYSFILLALIISITSNSIYNPIFFITIPLILSFKKIKEESRRNVEVLNHNTKFKPRKIYFTNY